MPATTSPLVHEDRDATPERVEQPGPERESRFEVRVMQAHDCRRVEVDVLAPVEWRPIVEEDGRTRQIQLVSELHDLARRRCKLGRARVAARP